jgi:hypothetical protein
MPQASGSSCFWPSRNGGRSWQIFFQITQIVATEFTRLTVIQVTTIATCFLSTLRRSGTEIAKCGVAEAASARGLQASAEKYE